MNLGEVNVTDCSDQEDLNKQGSAVSPDDQGAIPELLELLMISGRTADEGFASAGLTSLLLMS